MSAFFRVRAGSFAVAEPSRLQILNSVIRCILGSKSCGSSVIRNGLRTIVWD